MNLYEPKPLFSPEPPTEDGWYHLRGVWNTEWLIGQLVTYTDGKRRWHFCFDGAIGYESARHLFLFGTKIEEPR